MIKYNFYLSTKRKNKVGDSPIYLRFKIPGKIFEKSTGIYVLPESWDRENKKIIGRTKEVAILNETINLLSQRFETLRQQPLGFDALSKLIDRILSSVRTSAKIDSLPVIVDSYLKSLNERVDGHLHDSIKPVTLKKNEFLARTLIEFLEQKKLSKLPASMFDKISIREFTEWCHLDRNYSSSHTNRLTKFIKSILRYGIAEGFCNTSSAMFVKVKCEVKPIVYLSHAQLYALAKLQLVGSKLDRVRDLFLIQCYVGFSYCDLMSFNNTWIHKDIQGNLFIKYLRGKNGKPALVPLQFEALSIFEKYNYRLPVISNQKYNQYLKLLGLLLNFNFELTTHVGRKTCGSILLNNGVSIFTVKTILGHSSVKTTEAYYAELNEVGIIADFRKAQNINLANSNFRIRQVEMFN